MFMTDAAIRFSQFNTHNTITFAAVPLDAFKVHQGSAVRTFLGVNQIRHIIKSMPSKPSFVPFGCGWANPARAVSLWCGWNFGRTVCLVDHAAGVVSLKWIQISSAVGSRAVAKHNSPHDERDAMGWMVVFRFFFVTCACVSDPRLIGFIIIMFCFFFSWKKERVRFRDFSEGLVMLCVIFDCCFRDRSIRMDGVLKAFWGMKWYQAIISTEPSSLRHWSGSLLIVLLDVAF